MILFALIFLSGGAALALWAAALLGAISDARLYPHQPGRPRFALGREESLARTRASILLTAERSGHPLLT